MPKVPIAAPISTSATGKQAPNASPVLGSSQGCSRQTLHHFLTDESATSATTDPFPPYPHISRLGAQKHAMDGQSRFPPFEDPTIFAQEQINVILYGAGVCAMVSLAALVYLLQLKPMQLTPSSFSEPPNRQRLGKRRLVVVVLGTTTALLTMWPPTDPPFRSAAFGALVCAGVSLVASSIAVVRLWRLS